MLYGPGTMYREQTCGAVAEPGPSTLGKVNGFPHLSGVEVPETTGRSWVRLGDQEGYIKFQERGFPSFPLSSLLWQWPFFDRTLALAPTLVPDIPSDLFCSPGLDQMAKCRGKCLSSTGKVGPNAQDKQKDCMNPQSNDVTACNE